MIYGNTISLQEGGGDGMQKLVKQFEKNALKYDSRNTFEKTNKDYSFIPKALKDFYRYANPVDVEIYVEGNPIHFFNVDELKDIQDEYELGSEKFVFANSNADPIYLYKGKIYTTYHGSSMEENEFISNSFEKYLEFLIKSMAL